MNDGSTKSVISLYSHVMAVDLHLNHFHRLFHVYTKALDFKRVENFYKEQHTRQDYKFVMGMRERHLKFDKCVKTVWEMAEYLDKVVDDSDPDTVTVFVRHFQSVS